MFKQPFAHKVLKVHSFSIKHRDAKSLTSSAFAFMLSRISCQALPSFLLILSFVWWTFSALSMHCMEVVFSTPCNQFYNRGFILKKHFTISSLCKTLTLFTSYFHPGRQLSPSDKDIRLSKMKQMHELPRCGCLPTFHMLQDLVFCIVEAYYMYC